MNMDEKNKDIDKVESEEFVENNEATTSEATNINAGEKEAEPIEDKEEDTNDYEAEDGPTQPLLHALDFEQSESRTTNIPPRLPIGYSYGTERNTSAASTKKKKRRTKLRWTHTPTCPPILTRYKKQMSVQNVANAIDSASLIRSGRPLKHGGSAAGYGY